MTHVPNILVRTETEAGAWWHGVAIDLIEDEWADRDDTTFRSLLGVAVGDEAVQTWRQLSSTLLADRAQAASHRPRSGGPALGPATAVADLKDRDAEQVQFEFAVLSAVARMLSHADHEGPGADPATKRALVWMFLYLESLIVWEYTDDPLNRIRGVISALDLIGSADAFARLAIDDATERWQVMRELLTAPRSAERGAFVECPESDPTGVGHLAWASVELLRLLTAELNAENALFCSCPDDFSRQSLAACAGAARIARRLGDHLAREDASAIDPPVAILLELLRSDAERIEAYFGYLGSEVGPASRSFVHALWGAVPRADAVTTLERAAEQGSDVETGLARDVMSTEVRSHRRAMETMRDELARKDPLFIKQGEISLLFPFGLPDTDAEALTERLRAGDAGPAIPWLHGLPVSVIDTRQTDSWENWDNRTVVDRRNRSVTIALAAHDVVLETTEPARVHDIEVTVQLNSLGNHFVRVTVAAEGRVERPSRWAPDDGLSEIELAAADAVASEQMAAWAPGDDLPAAYVWPDEARARGIQMGIDGDADGNDDDGGWTAHEIDQWVRRATYQVGTERIRFIRHEDGRPEPGRTVGSFIRLARTIIDDLAPRARRLAPANRIRAPRRTRPVGHDPFNDLHMGAHVVILIERAQRGSTDGWVDLRSPDELPALLGASTLFLPQRPLPASLEEWVRVAAVPGPNQLTGVGLPNDLICRNRDVTLMCMFDSPNWAVLPMKEIVEFAASVSGVYSAWSIWLRSVVHDGATTVGAATPDGHTVAPGSRSEQQLDDLLRQSADIAANMSEVRSLLGHFRSAQLVRTSAERALLDNLLAAGGLDQAEQALLSSVEALTAQQQLVTSEAELFLEQRHRAEEAQRRVEHELESKAQNRFQVFISLIAVFGVSGLFSWFNSEVNGKTESWYVRIEVAAVLAFALVGTALLVRAAAGSSSGFIARFAPRPKEDKMRQVEFIELDQPVRVGADAPGADADAGARRLADLVALAHDRESVLDALRRTGNQPHRAGAPTADDRGERRDVVLPNVSELDDDECAYIVLRNAYDTVLAPSFNTDELIPFDELLASLDGTGDGCFVVAYDVVDGVRAAAVTEHSRAAGIELLSYLATVPTARGTGVGAKVIERLRQRWARFDRALVLGEIHDPRRWADTPDEHPAARLRFYAANDCKVLSEPWVQPALGELSNRVEDMLLIVLHQAPPARRLDAAAIRGWAKGYFRAGELVEPTDVTYRSLMERLGEHDLEATIEVLPLEQYESVRLLDATDAP
jgi:GNAT superfamily N-acetyltransferase